MTDEIERKIAKIEETFLGVEDHGILTAILTLNYGHAGQGTPGYALDEPRGVRGDRGRTGTAFGMEMVASIMRACGVRRWEDLKGRTIIALVGDDRVVGLAPLPTEHGDEFLFADVKDRVEPSRDL